MPNCYHIHLLANIIVPDCLNSKIKIYLKFKTIYRNIKKRRFSTWGYIPEPPVQYASVLTTWPPSCLVVNIYHCWKYCNAYCNTNAFGALFGQLIMKVACKIVSCLFSLLRKFCLPCLVKLIVINIKTLVFDHTLGPVIAGLI